MQQSSFVELCNKFIFNIKKEEDYLLKHFKRQKKTLFGK